MSGKLYRRPQSPNTQSILLRIGIVVGLLSVTVVVMYLEGGLIDNTTGSKPGFMDTLYFTMVTITTVGYGDIVPHTSFARLTDTFLLAPMRLIVFVLFAGIAYDLAFKRFQEKQLMSRVIGNLKDHTVMCGYGETGRSALRELLAQGAKADQIVVIEQDENALAEAAALGVVTVQGDATKELTLKSVAIERAKHVMICPGRDDTAVLITLTVRDLNASAKIVAMCHEAENLRLIERSGADTIVSPSFAGGNLMAASTRRPHLVDTMRNLLSIQGTLHLDERTVTEAEVGKAPRTLEGISVLRVYRGNIRYEVANFPVLEAGDVIVFVAAKNASAASMKPGGDRRGPRVDG